MVALHRGHADPTTETRWSPNVPNRAIEVCPMPLALVTNGMALIAAGCLFELPASVNCRRTIPIDTLDMLDFGPPHHAFDIGVWFGNGISLIMRFGCLTGLVVIAVSLNTQLSIPSFAQPPKQITNSIGMKLVLIPKGTFTMGEGSDAHEVTLTQPFYLSVYEVTQEQYERVMGKNPSNFKGPQNPVEEVSWDDAVEFCRKLSELPEEKAAGRVYRLPTEAEWEYACRAGTTTKYSFGDSESELGEYGWFDKNSDRKTHPVGQKQPNKWGLYDMHGNVWEWCSDWYGGYPKSAVTDPVGGSTGSARVFRGGSWSCGAAGCRSANRAGSDPSYRGDYVGFRVALSPSGIPKSAEPGKEE